MSVVRVRAVLLAALLSAGCEGEPPEPPEPSKETPAAIPSAQVGRGDAEGGMVAIMRPEIPDDVFFDDPLAIASDTARVGGAAGPEIAAAPADPVPMAASAGGGADAAVDWAALLPAEALTEEAVRIRERFEPKLASVAAFNNSLLEFPPYAAELAALAGIASAHPGEIPWKGNAARLRDLAAEMTAEELQRGQRSYDQVKVPFVSAAAILDGKAPDGSEEAAAETDFALAADFGFLMRRFEAGQNTVQATGGSGAAFKKNAADLAREMRVMAALSKVIADEDYGYGDDEKFQGFAEAMTKSAVDAAAAAEAGDFDKFGVAFNALGQSCNACHGEYRNN